MKFDQSIFDVSNPWYIGEMPSSHLVLNFDQSYVGRLILVPKTEFPDLESLSPNDLAHLMADVAYVGGRLKGEFSATRINYASLGNIVHQLHWHIIPRYDGDVNHGAPPWPVEQPHTPGDAERSETISRIRRALNVDKTGIAQVEPIFPLSNEWIDAYWHAVERIHVEVFDGTMEAVRACRATEAAYSYDERLRGYQTIPFQRAATLAQEQVTAVHVDRYKAISPSLGGFGYPGPTG